MFYFFNVYDSTKVSLPVLPQLADPLIFVAEMKRQNNWQVMHE